MSWGLRLIVPGGSTGLPVFCDPPPPHDCAALDPAVAGAGARLLLGSGLSYLSYGGLAGAWGGGAAQWSGSPSLCSQAGNLVRGRTGSTDDGGGGGSGTITWTCDRVGAGSAASCEPLGVWRESGSEGQRACGPQAGTAGQPQRLSASQPSAGRAATACRAAWPPAHTSHLRSCSELATPAAPERHAATGPGAPFPPAPPSQPSTPPLTP